MCSSACAIGIGWPEHVPWTQESSQLQFIVERLARRVDRWRIRIPERSVPRDAALASRSRLPKMRARGRRSESICSSAAADCRDETASRHWWRGGWMRRSRCNREYCRAAADRLRPVVSRNDLRRWKTSTAARWPAAADQAATRGQRHQQIHGCNLESRTGIEQHLADSDAQPRFAHALCAQNVAYGRF